MTQLPGVQLQTGALWVGGTTEFRSPAGTTATGDRNGSAAWPPPAHLYLTANLNTLGVPSLERVTVGIGLNSPFGSLTRYPTNGPFRTSVTFATLPLLDIKPTIAYRLTDQLSIGIGADIYTFSGLFGEGHVERQSIWPGGLGIPAGSRVELFGTDTAAGFNAGLLYTPYRNSDGLPLVNLALVYRSQATLNFSGGLLANGNLVSDARATFVLPQVITGGMAVWPLRTLRHEWKLEFDVDYVGWKSVRNVDIHLANGATVPQPQNWRSSYTVMVGTEYRWLLGEGLPTWQVALRAGYTNQQTQMPDLTFDPAIPSSDTHIPSIGIGFLCTAQALFLGIIPCGEIGVGPLKPQAIAVDFSYQAAIYEERTVTGNRNPTVNGVYNTVLHAGGITLHFKY
jgi:long-chain fatty acid transport protein